MRRDLGPRQCEGIKARVVQDPRPELPKRRRGCPEPHDIATDVARHHRGWARRDKTAVNVKACVRAVVRGDDVVTDASAEDRSVRSLLPRRPVADEKPKGAGRVRVQPPSSERARGRPDRPVVGQAGRLHAELDREAPCGPDRICGDVGVLVRPVERSRSICVPDDQARRAALRRVGIDAALEPASIRKRSARVVEAPVRLCVVGRHCARVRIRSIRVCRADQHPEGRSHVRGFDDVARAVTRWGDVLAEAAARIATLPLVQVADRRSSRPRSWIGRQYCAVDRCPRDRRWRSVHRRSRSLCHH